MPFGKPRAVLLVVSYGNEIPIEACQQLGVATIDPDGRYVVGDCGVDKFVEVLSGVDGFVDVLVVGHLRGMRPAPVG